MSINNGSQDTWSKFITVQTEKRLMSLLNQYLAGMWSSLDFLALGSYSQSSAFSLYFSSLWLISYCRAVCQRRQHHFQQAGAISNFLSGNCEHSDRDRKQCLHLEHSPHAGTLVLARSVVPASPTQLAEVNYVTENLNFSYTHTAFSSTVHQLSHFMKVSHWFWWAWLLCCRDRWHIGSIYLNEKTVLGNKML